MKTHLTESSAFAICPVRRRPTAAQRGVSKAHQAGEKNLRIQPACSGVITPGSNPACMLFENMSMPEHLMREISCSISQQAIFAESNNSNFGNDDEVSWWRNRGGTHA